MKKLLFRLVIVVAVMAIGFYYINKNFGTIENTVNVTSSQSIVYILLALVFSILSFYFFTLMQRKVFAITGLTRSMTEMFSLRTQALAMSVLVPIIGVSGGIVYAVDAREHGDSETAAVAGFIISLLVEYIAIVGFLIIAMGYLLSIDSLTPQIYIPAILLAALGFGLFLLLYLAGKQKNFLKKILAWGKALVNKIVYIFKKKTLFTDETKIGLLVTELENAYLYIQGDKKHFRSALGSVFVADIMSLVAIYILFLSFGIHPLYRELVSGYAIGAMAVVISPTPNGVGFAEGFMSLAYASMGIPAAIATAVSLIFRGMGFWLPFGIGMIMLQRKHLMGLVDKVKAKNF